MKRLLCACLLALAIMVGGFLPNFGATKLIVVFILVAAMCVIGYGIVLSGYRRPEKWPMATALSVGVLTAFAANLGGHSLWLTAFGESAHCEVAGVDSHSSSRGSTQWSNELNCGGKTLTYWPSVGYSVEDVGEKVDVVVDRTGLVRELEPGKVNPGLSLLFLLAVLMNAGLIFAVARLPLREPAQAIEAPE